MKSEIYAIYVKEHDISFIMEEISDDRGLLMTLEVVGFYYGEPDDKLNALYKGSTKAEFSF